MAHTLSRQAPRYLAETEEENGMGVGGGTAATWRAYAESFLTRPGKWSGCHTVTRTGHWLLSGCPTKVLLCVGRVKSGSWTYQLGDMRSDFREVQGPVSNTTTRVHCREAFVGGKLRRGMRRCAASTTQTCWTASAPLSPFHSSWTGPRACFELAARIPLRPCPCRRIQGPARRGDG